MKPRMMERTLTYLTIASFLSFIFTSFLQILVIHSKNLWLNYDWSYNNCADCYIILQACLLYCLYGLSRKTRYPSLLMKCMRFSLDCRKTYKKEIKLYIIARYVLFWIMINVSWNKSFYITIAMAIIWNQYHVIES